MTTYSVVWRAEVEREARRHLLQHYHDGRRQEDIALATWYPATGTDRYTAVIDEILLPAEDERILQGNVQMTRNYLRRCRQRALSKGAGMAVMHNHLGPGWQGMSADDVVMESRSVSNPARATGLPVLGLTLGTDGTWSVLASGFEETLIMSAIGAQPSALFRPAHLTLQANPQLHDPDGPSSPLERFRRSLEAWGVAGQERLGQLKIGIVGLGSVGALAAEAMGRMGIRQLVLIDMDRVEHHNLDRLIHAGRWDIGRYKSTSISRTS